VSALTLFQQRHAREAALAAVCAILFLTFLDNTIVSVALADIQSSLSVSVSGLQWVVDGYMLAFAALMLTGGTLGDLFGRKKVMLTGVVIFCAGSVVAAVAPSTSILIAGRLVMGLGAAASEPGTLSLIRHIYPERAERARALGVWAAVSGLALATLTPRQLHAMRPRWLVGSGRPPEEGDPERQAADRVAERVAVVRHPLGRAAHQAEHGLAGRV